MIKGGQLAWLLWQEGGVVVDALDHSGTVSSLSPGVHRREEGGETINIKQTIVTQSITWQNAMLRVT